MTIQDAKANLSAQLHGGTLNRVRNVEMLFERTANTLLSRIDPIDTMRTAALASTIHDDIYNYSAPSDFKSIVDLYPQDNRQSHDTSVRNQAKAFDLRRMLQNRTVSIEGSEGSKILRINWRSRQGKTIHTMNSVTDNGTWSAVGSATGVEADTIFKISGSASIKFDLAASGDGIQNTTMSATDLTNEDEVADFFTWIYFGTVPTSVSAVWGNDLTTNYWTSTVQTTQADGSAFKVGWNLLKFSWSTATETGSVNPATIDSFKITVAADSAQNNIRVDNIVCSIGRNFDLKYYSKYILKNSSGIWITRTTSDDDIVVLDNDAIQIWHLENLKAGAQQTEGADSGFDINWADKELERMYREYETKYPSQSKKALSAYGNSPARGRW